MKSKQRGHKCKEKPTVQSRKSKEGNRSPHPHHHHHHHPPQVSLLAQAKEVVSLGRYIAKQNKKVVKQVENNSILGNTRHDEQRRLIPQRRSTKAQRFPQLLFTSIPTSCTLLLLLLFYLEGCVQCPRTSERGWYPSSLYCLLILPRPSLPTRGSYCGRGCDWDSHSTEHQAMRKPGQAAN